jgi:glutamine amidotransferase-like uncharacterized protein
MVWPAWHPGVRSVVEALEREGVDCAALDRSRLTAEGLRGLDVLVLPGGWAPSPWAAAGETGVGAIRTFVTGGGRCVGVCAGAYLLSRTVRYDGKEYEYPLRLFDGVAAGPVAGLSPYPKPGSVRQVIPRRTPPRGLGFGRQVEPPPPRAHHLSTSE